MKYLYPYLLFFVTLCSYSQSQKLEAHWNVGDHYAFEVTKVKKKFENGKMTDTDSTTFYTQFKVLDKQPDSYTLSWRYENELLGKLKLSEKIKSDFADFNIIEVLYKTNEKGNFKGVTNWEAIAQKMNSMKGKLMAIMGADNRQKEILQNNLAAFMKIYSSKEGIEQIVLKELQAMHFAYGNTFTLQKVNAFDQQLPNVLGGDPVKGNATITLTKLDDEKKEMQLNYTMEVNPDDANRMVREFLNKLKLDNQKLKDAIANSEIKINDTHKFFYNYELGVPNYISTYRVSIMKI
jgi:hypothetical protein